MSLLEGKVIAITGAGRGLGRAYADAAAAAGARLVLDDLGCDVEGRSPDPRVVEQAARELRERGAEVVTSSASIETVEGAQALVELAVQTYGRIDGLVNNAGILRDGPLLDLTAEDFGAVLRTHLLGTFFCLQAAGRQMAAQDDGGVIVNTVSLAGLRGNIGQSNYAAAKGGVYGLTRAAALELSGLGVRVNAVAPLAVTRMTQDTKMVPETMRPEHAAPLVVFLLSPLSAGLDGRIFGAHGSFLFEYRMESSPGVREVSEWTPEGIAEARSRISFAPGTRAAAAASKEQVDAVRGIMTRLPACFRARRGARWAAVLHFSIAGAGDFTLAAREGNVDVCDGHQQTPTCFVETDAETFLGLAEGSLDGQQAYLEGRITASELGDLLKYQRLFDQQQAYRAYREQETSPEPSA